MRSRKLLLAALVCTLSVPALAQTESSPPITRSGYAELLRTTFGGKTTDYLRTPDDRVVRGDAVTREGALFLLVGRAMASLPLVEARFDVLAPYPDAGTVAPWAKSAVAIAIQLGIFAPDASGIFPRQLVTDAEAQAWVREARYPLLTFLSTNDFHGQLETGKLVSGKPVGGAAVDAEYVSSYRRQNPLGTLLLDVGDTMQGTPISALLRGRSTIDVFNHMGYQATTVGNHEFDWGLATLEERVAQARFPFLVANVFLAGSDVRPAWALPSVTFALKGLEIGVLGVTTERIPDLVAPSNVAGLEFRAPAPIVAQVAADLRAAGADVVVVLAHLPDVYAGVVSGEMAAVAQAGGADLIVSGQSHSGYSRRAFGVPLIQAYSSGTAIGVSSLRYDRVLRSVSSAWLKVETTYATGIVPDAGIAARVAAYQAEIAPIVSAVEGRTAGPISRTANGAGESPMGNLIADAQRWQGGTQLAFMNSGGIRASLEYTHYPHDVTWGDLWTVEPFDNELVTMTMTGPQIRMALEQQLPPNQTSPRVLAISGLEYVYDVTRAVGSRITSLTLSDGTPILDDGTTYTVTLNEFLAGGGDGFTAFLLGTGATHLGVSDLDALIAYLLDRYGTPPANTTIDPSVCPTIDGRITRVP